MKSTLWTDSIKSYLNLTEQVISRLPAQEYLEPKALNEILEEMDRCKALFLLQCKMQGFEPVKSSSS